ncbi:LacI family transcriptional regulator [Fulvitalea axinellae]|uniref:LacI family transcriptional regulator n=1 Tax=Fulvitalea axinellae TaxID=1182444 RepID=A0AAU9DFM6_9BACT|nr:LacI family transcriptional regulator [Fulvitalea axinellae]
MKKTQATIKDLARELNISVSTVSRALHDRPDISEKTKKAVRELAEKLDYQPNQIAQGLRQKRSYVIGVVVPEIVHHFFSTIISGIEDIAYERGFHVMVCQSKESFEREKEEIETLMSTRVDGIIVSVSKSTTDFDHFRKIQKRGIPLIFFDRICHEIKAPGVVCQDYEGAYEATEHFIKHGRKRVAHLRGPEGLVISTQRLNGYLDALTRNKVKVNKQLIVPAGDIDSGYEQTKKLLELPERPDGIFAVNDNAAAGALMAINEKGLEAPKDISVVGFNNDPVITKLTKPTLSSIHQPGFEMGQEAARMFFDVLDEKNQDGPKIKVLPTQLIERGSTL